jgi:hypothetical protein
MRAVRTTNTYENELYELIEDYEGEYYNLSSEYIKDKKCLPPCTFKVVTNNGDEFMTKVSEWLNKSELDSLEELLYDL